MRIDLEPIGYVRAPRPHAEDDFWGGEQARIQLVPQFAPDALAGLTEFSHIEVLFYFHQVDTAKIVSGARRRPYAARAGAGCDRRHADPGHQAGDGRVPAAQPVRQPAWSHELMREYWSKK